jgi:hypothetical protein
MNELEEEEIGYDKAGGDLLLGDRTWNEDGAPGRRRR